ncbi:hypothetical protein DORFOR_02693 [Dorea formicigenerans ATCC 27755]|uniref:Uncharacterized protein n=1 Tax=Dorea formicigenerans ATCC 27755 TaxID=411461 RepID=B0G8T2_9FIRM|nr:hypothetical protein DORFOR_02693 [Dorea formicigenerans ATCC 27755]
MVCKRLALLLSLLFRPFFTCFICKAILSLSSLFSPFFLLLDFFLEKNIKKIEHIDGFFYML